MIIPAIRDLEYSMIRSLNDFTDENTINLGIGRPYCKTPQVVKEAAIKAINEDQTTYTSNYGLVALRKAISRRYKYGDENNALVTIGAAEGIYLSMISLLEKEDEVLIPDPGYLAYEPIAQMIGCEYQRYPLDNSHQLDINKLSKLISNKTKVIIINNPGNPTGVAFKEEKLLSLIELAHKHGIMIISDEAYQGLTYTDQTVHSLLDYDFNEKFIVLSSVSKEFSMTGFRIGWIYADKELINEMVKGHLYMNSCAATPSQYAALAALESRDDSVRRQLKETKNLMYQGLLDIPSLQVTQTDVGLYYFVDISEIEANDMVFVKRLLEEENILAIPGSAFGTLGSGYIRLSYGAKPEDIKEAMKGLKKFCQEYDN